MSDPFSAVGSVVGIISLRLTVCHGIVSYYDGWHARDEDIDEAVKDVRVFSRQLSLLHTRIGKLPARQADIVGPAQELAARFTDQGITKLKAILKKCEAVPSQDGEKHRIHNAARRMLYPFKRATLQALREAVRHTQQSLLTLLQLLQMYAI